MYFCLTAPAKYAFIHRGRYRHFALAQWCLRDPEYFKLIQELRGRGDHIILDNGAYEGEMVDFGSLIQLEKAIQPQVLVMPDFVGRPEETAYVSRQFRDAYTGAAELMMVLHSRPTLEEYIYDYNRIPTPWIGIPKKLQVGEMKRTQVFAFLQRAGLIYSNKQHHLLGLNSDPLAEICAFRDVCVSCDNSLYKDCPNNLAYTIAEWEKICQASR